MVEKDSGIVEVIGQTRTLQNRRAYNVVTASTGVDVANSDLLAIIRGLIRTGATAGNLLPRYASEVSASLVTVKQDSAGILTQLA